MATSLNGWPVLNKIPSATFTAPNGKTVYTANTDVAAIFAYIAQQWHDRIEPLPPATDGLVVIHAWRSSGLTAGGAVGNHRSATAMDINGHLHPYEATSPKPYRDGFTDAQRAQLRKIASEVTDAKGRSIIRLGIDFASPYRDGMHLELAPGVTPAQVREAALTVQARQGLAVGTGAGMGRSGSVFFEGASGEDVKAWQNGLLDLGHDLGGYGADGEFGPATTAATKAHQHDMGITADGRVGPATLTAHQEYVMSIKEQLDRIEAQSMGRAPTGNRGPGATHFDPDASWTRDERLDYAAVTFWQNRALQVQLARVEATVAAQSDLITQLAAGQGVDEARLVKLIGDTVTAAVESNYEIELKPKEGQ